MKILKIVLTAVVIVVCLALVGICILMAKNNLDFAEIFGIEYVTNTVNISESIEKLSVEADVADVVIIPSEDETIKVEFFERETEKHTAEVKNGTLEIGSDKSAKRIFRLFSFGLKTPKISIYLPEGEYRSLVISGTTGDIEIPEGYIFSSVDISSATGDVNCMASSEGEMKIRLTTGNISVKGSSTGSLTASVSTGKTEISSVICEGDMTLSISTGKTVLDDISCENLSSEGSTGHMEMSCVVAKKKISVKRSTGHISFTDCDAIDIYMETTTGKIEGTLLTGKRFQAGAVTGRVSVPSSSEGGDCVLKTTTGNIEVDISGE